MKHKTIARSDDRLYRLLVWFWVGSGALFWMGAVIAVGRMFI